MVIGIDARYANYCYIILSDYLINFSSTWFYECQVFSSRGCQHLQAGQNPELWVLFYWLATLSRLPITTVFVFDGDRRPKIKRGKAVQIFPHWLTTSFRKLAEAFGFYCHTVLYCCHYHHDTTYLILTLHQAPGDAEAELAYLNQILAIDLVLTSDSNIFVFSATHVIRRSDPVFYYHLIKVLTRHMLHRQCLKVRFLGPVRTANWTGLNRCRTGLSVRFFHFRFPKTDKNRTDKTGSNQFVTVIV